MSQSSNQPSGENAPEKVSRPDIKNVIAVLSGKGGVGKSSVSALLAAGARRENYRVGLLDADITGPSIPRMFGINGLSPDSKVSPAESSLGIKIMSLNLLLPSEDDPVIWRGPLIGGAVKQFWTDIEWGELDYLFIDLPPGTADAPLTVLQSIPLDGLVVVTSPQELAVMVVKKGLKMARMMDVPILGLVENMSEMICPHCGKQVELFGASQGEEVSNTTGVPLMAKLPIDHYLAECCDKGEVEQYQSNLFNEMYSLQQKQNHSGGK